MKGVYLILMAGLYMAGLTSTAQSLYKEPYRPQIHFSPKRHWMNDPNGMVFYKGVYHLFFQYYPDGTTWGPMHWGHATSQDLVHWHEQPIALFPDSLGYIFSGSAVVDSENTSRFGIGGQIPLVAIFTQSDPKGAAAGKSDFQRQSLAYSLDEGKTWIKYAGNPVLSNPGIPDFRDPKVMWYGPEEEWIMTLATKDRVTFYSSPNLKDWKKEGDFGSDAGAHGGVWECPDLFALDDGEGKKKWVLIVSINPGGPNGGSATQYFTGSFDGHGFTADDRKAKWVDYGPDDYAGVTWSNTGDRKLFLGWMSNWNYANTLPTSPWRSANTLPRELDLKKVRGSWYLVSRPIKELDTLAKRTRTMTNPQKSISLFPGALRIPCKISLEGQATASFAVVLSNEKGEQAIVGYDKVSNTFFVDRHFSGKNDFAKNFAGKFTAPRLSDDARIPLSIVADASSIEVFADNGLTVMTQLVFPLPPFDSIQIQSKGNPGIGKLSLSEWKEIW
jgi:fructan beta-fructosidase